MPAAVGCIGLLVIIIVALLTVIVKLLQWAGVIGKEAGKAYLDYLAGTQRLPPIDWEKRKQDNKDQKNGRA